MPKEILCEIFWHEKGEGADRVGSTHVMSHDPYLLSDLNLIQIKDMKIRKNEIKFYGKVLVASKVYSFFTLRSWLA